MKKGSALDKASKVIAWFMGSWWGVFTHTFWFAIWLVLDFSVERLTFWVSLEAIFIGIFLLMAANQAELERDRREARERAREMQHVKEDLLLDRQEAEDLKQVKEMLSAVQADLRLIKNRLEEKE